MTIVTPSVAATLDFGRRLGAVCPAGLCLALHGPLGAGKTHLVRGLALGARVADPDLVSSPTYVLLNVYPPSSPPSPSASTGEPAGKTVYHLDAYRAHGVDDFEAVGLEEILDDPGDGLIVIEWPSRIADLLPADRLDVYLEVVDDTTRRITLSATGPRAAGVIAQIIRDEEGTADQRR